MHIGWYYLHENGDLIYKPGSDSIIDIRDSSFAKCSWPLDQNDRKSAWDLLVEASALGANKERINELAEKWKCNDSDADNYANAIGLHVGIDGNQWCVHLMDFINLQESPAGFGETKLEAMAELAVQLGVTGGHMWRKTFSDYVAGK